MATDHHVEVPKFIWILRIVQLVVAVLVFCLACADLAIIPSGSGGLALFTALFSMGHLIYYFVVIHSQHDSYNWIALLVLECLAIVFWLSSWALLAAVVAAIYTPDLIIFYGTVAEYEAWKGIFDALLAFSLINWILYIITLVFFALGIHKHRMAGRPIMPGGQSASSWDTAAKEEKHDMQPMPPAQQQQPQQAPPQQQEGPYQPTQGYYGAAEAPSSRY